MTKIEMIMSAFERLNARYFRVVGCSNAKLVLRCDDYAYWASGYPWAARAKSANGCVKAWTNDADRRVIMRFGG